MFDLNVAKAEYVVLFVKLQSQNSTAIILVKNVFLLSLLIVHSFFLLESYLVIFFVTTVSNQMFSL